MGLTESKWPEILERIAGGELLVDILDGEGMPSKQAVWAFMHNDKSGERTREYAEARQAQAECWGDEIVRVAADASRDTIIRRGQDGSEYEAPDNEWINRSRLKVDTMKWVMARVHGRRWGDQASTQIALNASGPVQIVIHDGDAPAAVLPPAASVDPQRLAQNGSAS